MLIQDLRFIEETNGTDKIRGGAGAFTQVDVSAKGSTASVISQASGSGQITGADTTGYTTAASSNYYKLSAAAGSGVAYGITIEGNKPKIVTSISTGVATDIKLL